MQTIIVFGAGKTGAEIIAGLLSVVDQHRLKIIAADISAAAALAAVNKHVNGEAIQISVTDYDACETLIGEQAAIVISALPPNLDDALARICFNTGVNFITVNAPSSQLKKFDADNARLGILFLYDAGGKEAIDLLVAITLRVLDEVIDTAGVISCKSERILGLINH